MELDSHLAVYGGVVLQQCEFIKVSIWKNNY